MYQFYDRNAKLRYIKFCLLLYGFLFVLNGIVLIIICSTINAIYVEYSHLLQIEYFTPATCLVATGFAIFGVACIGLYGTLKRHPFGILLGVICIAQFGAGVACYMMSGDLIHSLRFVLNQTMFSYPEDKYAHDLMDAIQGGFRCCGVDSVRDWDRVYQVYNRSGIPRSCCVNADGLCEYINNRGCFGVLEFLLVGTSNVVTASSFVLGFMQVTGMVSGWNQAKCLLKVARKIEKPKWLKEQIETRKMRKLLLAEQLLHADEPDHKN